MKEQGATLDVRRTKRRSKQLLVGILAVLTFAAVPVVLPAGAPAPSALRAEAAHAAGPGEMVKSCTQAVVGTIGSFKLVKTYLRTAARTIVLVGLAWGAADCGWAVGKKLSENNLRAIDRCWPNCPLWKVFQVW